MLELPNLVKRLHLQYNLTHLIKFWWRHGLKLWRHNLYFKISFFLKSDSPLPKKIIFICLNESPLQVMKNAFYFILKALFVLKIFKFLPWLFGYVEEMA